MQHKTDATGPIDPADFAAMATAVARAATLTEAAAAVAARVRILDPSAPFACLLAVRVQAVLHLVVGHPAGSAAQDAKELILRLFRDHAGEDPHDPHVQLEVHKTVSPDWNAHDSHPITIRGAETCHGLLLSPRNAALDAWLKEAAHWLGPVMTGADRLLLESRWDPVTQVFNRRYLQETLIRLYAQAVRYRLPLGLLLVDVDHFKRINDRFGHPAGDRALREVARALGETVRAGDVLCRYGGDEFAVILPHTDTAGAQSAAKRAADRIPTHRVRMAGHNQHLSISVGAAAYEPDHPQADAPTLINQADQDLYRSRTERRRA